MKKFRKIVFRIRPVSWMFRRDWWFKFRKLNYPGFGPGIHAWVIDLGMVTIGISKY